jgi:thiosulfate/3-mercaptopyruvate sulfurtransferase
MDSLVSTDWLARHLGEADLVAVDASWHMPASGRSGAAEFLAGHVPGARFFDIDELSDASDPAPHMLTTADEFGAAMERLGIGSSDRIVVYDNSPVRSAARAWFMFRHFGARKVAILDGGFGKWAAEQRPVERGEAQPRKARFETAERPNEVCSKKQILEGPGVPLVDARGRGRFEGTEPEPRAGLAGGHIPGSRNLPFGLLYDEKGCFRPAAELRQLFADAGADPSAPFIATCGSGVTASALIFAAHLLGEDTGRLYDGSWSEWGADPETAKAIGPA